MNGNPTPGLSADRAAILYSFMKTVQGDARITVFHISVFICLVCLAPDAPLRQPLSVFGRDMMPLCKISGSATYHRTIRQLAAYGYIRYVPSCNHFMGSLVFLVSDTF
ncbi:MAG: hypothetical protein QM764_22415 [Chitinophagaceae bacterium]